jgi:acetolactate synthase-1/3 small subunit
LVKVRVPEAQITAFERVVAAFKATAIHIAADLYVVEMSGSSEKVDELINSFIITEVIEVVRSGVIGLATDERVLSVLAR